MKDAFYGGSKLLDAKNILKRVGVNEGMTVADLGCGVNGHFCCPASHFVGDRGTVYAVDVRKTALDNITSRARSEGATNVKTVLSNLEKYGSTDIASSSIDIVLLINVLFQTKNDYDVLRESVRLLADNGRILVVDWKDVKSSAIGPMPNIRVNKGEVVEMLNKLGLELVEDFSAGKHHFGMIFKK